MAKRSIIEIDREKCIGCARCAETCHQGAIAMVDGRAKLVRSDHCDGLGRCLGECPADAITIIEVDEPHAAASPALPVVEGAGRTPSPTGGGCPGHRAMQFDRSAAQKPAAQGTADAPSALSGWPIQLHLIRPESEMFQGADVLIAASCSAFAFGAFHGDLLRGKSLIIACPKLDRQDGYPEKLETLFAVARPASVTIARMEVPCCNGLTRLVTAAHQKVASNTPIREVVLSLQGDRMQVREIAAAG